MDNKFNMRNLVIFLAIVIAFIILIRILSTAVNDSQSNQSTQTTQSTQSNSSFQENNSIPDLSVNPLSEMKLEGFTDNTDEKAYEPVDDKNKPQLNPQTGMLVDGPGFETGQLEGAGQPSLPNVPANYYFLDDGSGGEMSIQNNLCSKSCCSEQWPTPFKMKYDPYVCKNKSEFVPSNTFCNNSFQDAGCLCLSKKQSQFLYNRGGNGNEWF